MRKGFLLWSCAVFLGGCTVLNSAYGDAGGTEGGDAEDPKTTDSTDGGNAAAATDASSGLGTAGSGSFSTSSPAESSDTGATGESGDGDESTIGNFDLGEPSRPAYIIYLHFGGVTLSPGIDDASEDVSSSVAGAFAPYQHPENIPVIVEALEDAWSGLSVEFVTDRPAGGDYAMVVISPTNPLGGAVVGVGTLDCGDANHSSVAAAFSDDPTLTPVELSAVISRELGFTFGLEPVETAGDFMTSLGGVGTQWVDECNVLGPESPACDHPECPVGRQNSYAALEFLVGPR